MKISEMELDLVRPDGFDEWFNKLIADGFLYRDAFHILNTIYRKTYGIERYSSYDSYRRVRRRRIKNGTMSHRDIVI
ncbi:MAG TPA: hypothetical protein VJ964_03205 [Balneolaceae bacterium]|nr:hypothetical protein [Balneolaceae bacterium]